MPPPGPPDEELIEGFKAGDRGAFAQIVQRYQTVLVNFFYHQCYDSGTAEDLTQEVFLRLHRHLASYEPRSKFTSFLFRVAKNLWIDRVRRTRAGDRKEVSLDAPMGGHSGSEPSTVESRIASATDSPSEFLLRDEMRDTLRRALERLPEEHRMVVILSEIQGMKYHEIGEVLGIPVGTVKSRMHHAIERLKEILKNVYP
jgi:RNA polymerase sigma-70 factor (ECF subfamily)